MTLKKFNKFSFKSESLLVNYFELKFDDLSEHRKQKIVKFFFKLGFNSFDVDKKYREPRSSQIQINSKNQYEIQFVVNVSTYWDGSLSSFSLEECSLLLSALKGKKD
jgi:hypothetical protein